jgi:hypothetical protein
MSSQLLDNHGFHNADELNGTVFGFRGGRKPVSLTLFG